LLCRLAPVCPPTPWSRRYSPHQYQIITRTSTCAAKEQLKQEAQQQVRPTAEKIVAERDKDVLRDLIDQGSCCSKKGKDLGITADTK